jgi:hypothetical protein
MRSSLNELQRKQTTLPRVVLESVGEEGKAMLEQYSSAATLTAHELELFPALVQAQLYANLMTPSLWGWKDLVPRRSGSPVRRKVEGIKQHIISNYSFTHVPGQPGLDLTGTTTIEGEKERFAQSEKSEWVFENLRDIFGKGNGTALSELLGVEDIRAYYRLDEDPPGTIPAWGNEILDKMDAYRKVMPENRGSGKCEALASLYAAALIAVGGFPPEDVLLLFTTTHVMACLLHGKGYISSNKRMFSSASLCNLNEHTRVVRSCLEEGEITRLQSCAGLIDVREAEVSIPRQVLEGYYRKLGEFAAAADCRPPRLPELQGKAFVPPMEIATGLSSAGEWRDHVHRMAAELPGSAFDLARYAYRELDVTYPEAYARAALHRSPHSRRRAIELGSVSACIDFAREGMNCCYSRFGQSRLGLPDETLTMDTCEGEGGGKFAVPGAGRLGSAGHRDRALMLYAMVGQLSEEPLVVFGERNSYILHQDRLIPIDQLDKDERVLALFNSSSHGVFPQGAPVIGELS